MLNYLMPSRRRAEAARVDRFVHAIALSGRYSLNPDWELATVPDEAPVAGHSDTAPFPRVILAGTVLAATVALSACSGPVPMPLEQSGATPPVQTVAPGPIAPAPVPGDDLTGTDAGLITEPAPSAPTVPAAPPATLDEHAAAAVPRSHVPSPSVPTVAPAPAAVNSQPAPVVAEETGQQDASEVIGSYRCEDVTMIVVAVNADGSWDCQVVDQ